MLIFSEFYRCNASERRYEGPWSFLREMMWSLASPRANRISGLYNFSFFTRKRLLQHYPLIAVIPEDQFLTPSRHARLPDVVKCVPLSVSTLWILNGTAVTRRRRKSAAVLRATFSCTSTKANLEGAVDRDEQVELALRGSNFG